MIAEEGWTDIGKYHNITRGNPDQYTCHANAGVQQSRIDFFITNDRLTPAIKAFEVIQDANYPTHKPIRIKVVTAKLTTVTNQLRKTTDYAAMFQEKVDNQINAKQIEADKEAKEKNDEVKKVDAGKIRKRRLSFCPGGSTRKTARSRGTRIGDPR